MKSRLSPITALVAALLCWSPEASAKRHGLASPSGRAIYDDNERVFEVRDQSRRHFVVEVASGLAPEGNLGILLGWINQPVKGLEWYAGVGTELTPSVNATGTLRYMFNLDGYRPYIATGYLYREVQQLGSYSHNWFVEAGYKWILHRTYHLTAGIGVRRLLHVGVHEDSILRGDQVDPNRLDQELDAIAPYAPLVSLRFSRAF
jgi:hypothetical protein